RWIASRRANGDVSYSQAKACFYGWKHVGERRANPQSLTPREAQITQNSINAQAIRTNSMKSRIIAHL
ncbi:hypothetical protein, partial [Staphylococcus aureus]|uniref:hypothetical protein n=1 Tax=Staphylococcus aureus TaxID=1280 RepID=UPI0038B3FA1B